MQAEAVSAATAVAEAAADAVASATPLVASTPVSEFLQGLYYLIMVPGVYLSIAGFVLFSAWQVARILRSPPPPYQLAIYPEPRHPLLAALRDTFGMPQVMRKSPLFWFFLMMYHAGFLLLVVGHFDLFPRISVVSEESRHMVGAGLVGVMVTLPTFYFIGRRFRSPVRELSTPGDYLLLLLILFLFLFGDLMSWGNSWTINGFVMTKQDFAAYFDILGSWSFADPRGVLPGSHYHFAVIHVLLAELFFLVLPFTKIVHTFFSLPVNIIRRRVWTRN
jgi:nitrate reductase gamma subunit